MIDFLRGVAMRVVTPPHPPKQTIPLKGLLSSLVQPSGLLVDEHDVEGGGPPTKTSRFHSLCASGVSRGFAVGISDVRKRALCARWS